MRNKSGFTLAELLIAGAIIGIVMLMIMSTSLAGICVLVASKVNEHKFKRSLTFKVLVTTLTTLALNVPVLTVMVTDLSLVLLLISPKGHPRTLCSLSATGAGKVVGG